MKIVTGLLIGAAMLVSGSASAQYYSQASVSGVVLSYGPEGFMLQGPDGNYGIAVGAATVITDPWNTFVVTGPGNVLPGDYVTATGYPVSQWVMRATQVIVRNGNATTVYPSYGGYFGSSFIPGVAVFRSPNQFAPGIQGPRNFNTLPMPMNNPFLTGSAPR